LIESRKDRAEAEFKKTQRALEGRKAMSDYEAEAAAVRARTEKLKALRLARDAANAAAAPLPAKRARKVRVPGPSLAAWLKDRDDSGHNN
jgi:hypothetical protein